MARKLIVVSIVSGIACLSAVEASAQQVTLPADSSTVGTVAQATPVTSGAASPETSGESALPALDTILVTAQKRAEDPKKVPISVTAISGADLQNNHIDDFADLTLAVPNMSFSTQAGEGLSTLELRGVSSQAGSAVVGVYLDDVSLTTRNLYSQGTAEPRFFDIDRVEVLRGPQGTLYGAGSEGGTVRFISNQPDLNTFSGSADSQVSSTEHGGTNYQVQGILNIPLIDDRVGLRVGVQQGHQSGYVDQVDPLTLNTIAKGINSSEWSVVKLALKAKIADGWTLTTSLFAQDYKSKDIDTEYLNVGDYQPYNAGTPLPKYETSKIVREPSDDRLTIPSMTLTGDVGFADLTAVASSYTRRFSRIQDGTYINSSYLGTQVTDPALGYTVGNLPSAVLLDNGIDENSFEVRLASKPYDISRSSLTWVGGVFYSRTKTNVYDVEPVYGINSAFSSAGQNIANPAALAGAFLNDFPNDNSYYSARHYDDQQQALFGEVTYYLTPGLRLTAGLRYLEAEQNFHRDGGDYFAGGPTSVNINSSTSANTPRFAIDWDATRSTTAYINIAKGFRLGAANRPIPNTGAVQEDFQNLGVSGYPAVFNPDSLWSYELGTKSRFLDNRITLNADLFYIRWNNIQQDIELPISGFDYEANVGSAISEGGEVELKARVAAPLLISASFGYTHAVFGEDVPSLGVDGDGDLNVRKGDPIEGVPRFNARLGGEYRFAALADADGILRLSGSYVGPSHGTFIRDQSDYLRPGYFSADASATLQFNRYEVSLFVTNLTNNQTILQQPVIQSVNEAYRLRPRTIGLSLSAYL